MRHIARLMRSASLSGYVELVKSLGRDPHVFMRTVGLQPKVLEDPEALIPRDFDSGSQNTLKPYAMPMQR